jgi:hypothetical protein
MRLLLMSRADDRLRSVEIALLWAVVAAAVAITCWPRLDDALVSTDNVMRMVEVRALLHGAPWFDPHEARLFPPAGYDTHWSRLIDGGIAGLIVLFRQFTAPDFAERLARCLWPLLVSGPALGAIVAIAVRLGGAGAGRAALLIGLSTIALFGTFRPGEIDHHNVQIMLALVLCACALWYDRRYMAAAAGIAGGVLLSVGLEAAHVLVAFAAAFGLLAVRDESFHRPARAFALALAATTLAGYLIVTPAAFRLSPQCDALAINSTAAVISGALALAILGQFGAPLSRASRLLILAAGGAIALAVFAAFEPRCLKGPFGLIDPVVFPLWLDHVQEMQSISQLFNERGMAVIVFVAFPFVAAFSVLLVVRFGLRTPIAWALVASFAISFVMMFGEVRASTYAIWLGAPFVGATAQMLAERIGRVMLTRAAAATLASPAVVSLLAAGLTASAATKQRVEDSRNMAACVQPAAYRTLAALKPGLVLAPVDLGPSILANTPHSIVAAPYHRADAAIRFNQEIMEGPFDPDASRAIERGVDYVVTCTGYTGHVTANSFHEALLAGKVGAWLAPLPVPDGAVVKIWRVAR